jgi:hypothetical protein
MKKELVALICSVALYATGCATDTEAPNKSVQVVVEGGGEFPPSLAGTKPGQITTTRVLAGGNAIFEPGQWTVDYMPRASELTIKIPMRHIHVDAGENIVDGRSTGTFIGKVDADQGFWPVQ